MYRCAAFLIVIVLAACGGDELGNPTPQEVLDNNPAADIFEYEGNVYSNARDLDHYDINDYDKGTFIGEIENTTDNPRHFNDFTASSLPTGTPLYSTTNEESELEFTIIAATEEEDILYIALLEG